MEQKAGQNDPEGVKHVIIKVGLVPTDARRAACNCEEAEERYKYMKATMPKNYPGAFGPVNYGGGRLNTPKFEISKYLYDKQTMGPEYKGFKREARYYFEKDGVTTVEGWRLK